MQRFRPLLRPTAGEWALYAYLLVVAVISILAQVLGRSVVHALASSPNDVAAARAWLLVTSGLVAEGPLLPQVAGTAALGVAAMRLAGGGACSGARRS